MIGVMTSAHVIGTISFGLLAAIAAPGVSANHGLVATVTGTLDDGSTFTAALAYESGNDYRQTWSIAGSSSLAGYELFDGYCFGSIEGGFRCNEGIFIGGVGHWHTFLDEGADAHFVTLRVGWIEGSGLLATSP